jgi:hypothetical protein
MGAHLHVRAMEVRMLPSILYKHIAAAQYTISHGKRDKFSSIYNGRARSNILGRRAF